MPVYPVSIPTISAMINGGGSLSQDRFVPLPDPSLQVTMRRLAYRVIRGGNLAGTVISWKLKRRLEPMTVDAVVAQGGWGYNLGGTQSGVDTRSYKSAGNEIITFEYWFNDCNDGNLTVVFDDYIIVRDVGRLGWFSTIGPDGQLQLEARIAPDAPALVIIKADGTVEVAGNLTVGGDVAAKYQ